MRIANPENQSRAMSTETVFAKAPEILVVEDHKVSCDGGGALGHPRTWYEMGDDDYVVCKYCDRVFVLKGGKQDQDARA